MANIVTAKEISQYLKLSESTVYKLASAGEIPGFKIGDSWRFDMDLIISMINSAIEGAVKRRDQLSASRSEEKESPLGQKQWEKGNKNGG